MIARCQGALIKSYTLCRLLEVSNIEGKYSLRSLKPRELHILALIALHTVSPTSEGHQLVQRQSSFSTLRIYQSKIQCFDSPRCRGSIFPERSASSMSKCGIVLEERTKVCIEDEAVSIANVRKILPAAKRVLSSRREASRSAIRSRYKSLLQCYYSWCAWLVDCPKSGLLD